ncbi:MAG: 1-acyl-sn-glycerol-3-phosphate acyltransferase [Arenicella sp.]|nr:1-acyl-sn-glycerol-3-phosphate acyltransferase [Arenicella sp.]
MPLLSLNHYWRIAAAGLSYVVFGVGASLPGLYILFLALVPMEQSVKQRKVRNAISCLCRFYVNFMQFLGLFSFTVTRARDQDIEGHLVISNHAMLIDALFILAYVDNLCCVVKSDLCRNPFTRIPVRLAGYIPNNHDELIDIAKRKLEAGENILIFPEGTRNKSDFQLEFKRGVANIAVASNAPILPIVVTCTPRVLGKGEKWYQLPSVKSRISIRFDPSLRALDCIDATLPRTLQYRYLTRWLRDYYFRELSLLLDQK